MKTIEIIQNNVVNNSFCINFDCLKFIKGNRNVINSPHITAIEEAMKYAKKGENPIVILGTTSVIAEVKH